MGTVAVTVSLRFSTALSFTYSAARSRQTTATSYIRSRSRKPWRARSKRRLGGAEVAEVAQQLAFLPFGAQQDQAVAELLVEVPRLRVDRQRLLRLLEVDVAAHQVVAGGEQQVRVALVVDQGDRLVEQVDAPTRPRRT